MGLNMDFKLKFVIQRVSQAEVIINNISRGKIQKGLVVLVGIAAPAKINDCDLIFNETEHKYIIDKISKCIDKISGLRIFSDDNGKMNLNLSDIDGSLYLISQFTLFADCTKGFRPSFSLAAKPIFAEPLYNKTVELFKQKLGEKKVFTGIFAADMQINLSNDGPVTIIIEIDK